MKILALETTESTASVAALRNEHLLYELRLDPQQRSAQSLAPGIAAVLEKMHWKPGEVDLVAVAAGPGSFTGLRVGVTTAKVFAYCARAEVLGVDTLEVIAARTPAEILAVSVAVDAQRGEVVARLFRRKPDGCMAPVEPAERVGLEHWLESVPPDAYLSGPVLRKVSDRIGGGLRTAPPECWGPTASAVGQVAARHYAQGRRDDLWALVPHYCRPSAAEEKRP